MEEEKTPKLANDKKTKPTQHINLISSSVYTTTTAPTALFINGNHK